MESFFFSLRATAPVFLLMLIGWFFARIGLIDAHFCKIADRLVFHVTLPVMLFCDMAKTDLYHEFDWRYVLFCALATTVIFFSIWIAAKLFLRDASLIGEFVQVSYRSSAAILGVAMINGVYGDSSMAPLMILGSVPLFNLYAVLVLTLEGPHAKDGSFHTRLQDATKNIAKNPIILGILLGTIPSLLGISSFPPILDKTLSGLASLTTPLALLSIGSSLHWKDLFSKFHLSATAAALKLLILPTVFLPLAIYFGFMDAKLMALIIMLGGTATPTCYVMAKNLGHEGKLSANVIIITTVLSAFTLTFWIFLMRYLGYLS